MPGASLEYLLPLTGEWLPGVSYAFDRCSLSMEEDEAAAVANRVMLHLYRGSIELARAALEDGWRSHLRESAPLPTGKALLDEPLARVVDDIRMQNYLESAEIYTVGDLLVAGDITLLAIPGMGATGLAKIKNLQAGMLLRVQDDYDQP